MSNMIAAQIKSFPPGWTIIDSIVCSCQRDAFILCEKSNDRRDDTRYVTWEADLVLGGCYRGRYTEDLEQARQDLKNRAANHS